MQKIQMLELNDSYFEDVDKSIILERNESIKDLCQEISQIRYLYEEFSMYVGEQGAKIDNLEASISDAAENVSEGVEQVESAAEIHVKNTQVFLKGAFIGGAVTLGGIILFPFLHIAGLITGGVGISSMIICGVAHKKF